MDDKILARLEIVAGYANRITQTINRAGSYDGFLADYDLQYSVAHSISQIAETLNNAMHADPQLADQILHTIPYRDIKRMRDKIQHHYGSIDPDIVWSIATLNIPELKKEIEALIDSST